uniref:Uncharacterized protein n=1 Tax=Arundo donax TaxID=35708 RepID=A0A0A9FCR6_ARUDO
MKFLVLIIFQPVQRSFVSLEETERGTAYHKLAIIIKCVNLKHTIQGIYQSFGTCLDNVMAAVAY